MSDEELNLPELVEAPAQGEAEPVARPTLEFTAAPVPVPAPVKKGIPKPHIAVRVLLQLVSFVLAMNLFGAVISSAVLMDLREITSEGGIKKIVNALLVPTAQAPVTVKPAVIQADRLSMKLEEADPTVPSLPGDITVDENGNITIGGDASVNLGDIPSDILTGGGADGNVLDLVDWVYDQIAESTDNPMKYTKEEMREFVQESTVSDFLSEKLAGYAGDFINGTEETVITAQEVMALLEENKDLMESKLNMELSQEQWSQLEETVDKMVVESNISVTIRDTVYEAVDNVLEENSEMLGGLTRENIQNLLQQLVSGERLIAAIVTSVVLLLLLCLANYYNIPAGLTWAGVPTLLAGLLLVLPLTVLDSLAAMVPELGAVAGVLASFVDVFAPIHYGLLAIGGGLLLISIVWRVIRASIRKSRVAA